MPVTSRDIENVITKFEPFIKGSSDILIIGDTPTKDNIIDGKPFTGNGAKRIAAMLMNIGVLTNAPRKPGTTGSDRLACRQRTGASPSSARWRFLAASLPA